MQTKIIKVNPNFPEQGLIKEAADILKKGGLVAFPTETVYGIAANFQDASAIDRLYEIKKRPKNKPFTIQIAKIQTLEDLNIVLDEKAGRVMRKYWPGPLTIVALNRGNQKVGIRIPGNKIALNLIEAAMPIAVPSANISGDKPPTSAAEVALQFSGSIDMILDGGVTEVGIESTVLDVTTTPFTILRQGAIPGEDLLIDYRVLFVCTGNSCRSVMAQALLEEFIQEAGLSEEVHVDSAGTNSYYGIQAAPNTIEIMREEELDVSTHSGKGLTQDLLKKQDLIYVMEYRHKEFILNRFSGMDLDIRLLKGDENIQDPIGRSIEEYKRIKDIIKNQVENIFLELFKKEKHR